MILKDENKDLLKIVKKDPKKHSRRFKYEIDKDITLTNPFKNVDDVVKYSKEIREQK